MNWFTLFTSGVVPVLIQYFARVYRQEDADIMASDIKAGECCERNKTYDFIVVGAGSAGCVVAGRLAEHGFSVLLLEAGGNPTPASDIIYLWQIVSENRDINYHWAGQAQRGGPNKGRGQQSFSGGKMMGGSGSHNGCVHNRGSPGDYDNWARVTSDTSWAYNNVRKYFKKMENRVGQLYDNGTEDEYGHDGPLTLDTDSPPILPVWFEAARELGYHAGDANGPQREGFHAMQMLRRNGRRVSSFTGYVRALERSKACQLTVLRYSDVQRILFSQDESLGKQPRAIGVSFIRHGQHVHAFASLEVIISAGTIRSPLLLQKSGVGPRALLEGAGIQPVAVREGVGLNLGDHEAFGLGPFHLNDSVLPYLIRVRENDPPDWLRFIRLGKGPLAGLYVGPQAFFVSSRAHARGENDWPDISITLAVDTPGQEHVGPVYLYVVNARSRTRGSVMLDMDAWRRGERDDTRLARIDFQLMSHAEDVQVLAEGIKIGLRIMENTTAWQQFGAVYAGGVHEPCGLDHGFRSDKYWKCVVRASAGNWIHIGGTNAMGLVDDPYVVLDSKLKVIGVDGLRVIDASSMPVVPNGNTNAPSLMLGEKGAAEIIKEHRHAPVAAQPEKGSEESKDDYQWIMTPSSGNTLFFMYMTILHLFAFRLWFKNSARARRPSLKTASATK